MSAMTMWLKALRIVPRVDKAEWMALDLVSKWLIATRSAVFVMTFFSAAVAGVLAYRVGQFDGALWLLVVFGLVLAHATNNLLNDYIDHVKGVDKNNYFRARYGPQPLEHGLLTKQQLLAYIVITGAAALAIGGYLSWYRGGLTPWLLLAGVFFAIFYTWPLKHWALGEITVLLVWGPLMVGGGYYVITGVWDWQVVLISLPYALGPTAVIFGKHIDKLREDRGKVLTLPVLLGDQLSRNLTVLMLVSQYVLVVYLVITGAVTPLLLAVALALPALLQAIRVYRQPAPAERPAWFPAERWPLWFVAHAFNHNRRFGALFLLALLADALFVVNWPGQ